MFAVIRKVRALENLAIEVTWKDGELSVVSLRDTVARSGVFAALNDPIVFRMVELGDGGRWVQWPEELDICADDLWYQAHPDEKGHEIELVKQ